MAELLISAVTGIPVDVRYVLATNTFANTFAPRHQYANWEGNVLVLAANTFAPWLTDLVLLISCYRDSHGLKIASYLREAGNQYICSWANWSCARSNKYVLTASYYSLFWSNRFLLLCTMRVRQLSIFRHTKTSDTAKFEFVGIGVIKMISHLHIKHNFITNYKQHDG